MRLLLAIALMSVVAFPVTAQPSNSSNNVLAQKNGKKKGNTFSYTRCRNRGITVHGCGVQMQRFLTRNPNGKVID